MSSRVAARTAPVSVNPPLLHPQEHRLKLDGTWAFRLDPDDTGLSEEWFDSHPFSEQIQVPGTWQGQGFGTDAPEAVWDFQLEARIYRATYSGTAWYARSFELPDGWSDGRTWINFGGAHPSADVWLNGARLGSNNAPFVPFAFEITDRVAATGENVLVVRVHEENRDLGLAYSWQGNWSGLYRSVELTATGTTALDRFWLHADVDAELMRMRVRLDGTTSSGPHVLVVTAQSLASPGSRPASIEVPVAAGDNAFELQVPAPDLWSPDTPNLYRVDAVLRSEGEMVDCGSERTGFVKLSPRDKRFYINDEPYFMRGSCDHHSSPLTGCPDWDRDRWRRNLTTLKEYGYNWTRLVYAYNPEYYDAADEVGLLVQSEMGMLGGWGGDSVWHVYQWPQPMPDRRQMLKWQWDHTVMRDVNWSSPRSVDGVTLSAHTAELRLDEGPLTSLSGDN